MATRALHWSEVEHAEAPARRRSGWLSAIIVFVTGVRALFRFYVDHYLHAD
jgi:hypothetical protein